MDQLNFRKALNEDIYFLIEGIVESEKSNSNVLSYSALFNIDEKEFKNLLLKVFKENIPNQPWCLDHCYIAELNNNPVASLIIWRELEFPRSSEFLKLQILFSIIPTIVMASKSNLKEVSNVKISRSIGCLQLEHLYTVKEFQRKGIMKLFLNFIFNEFSGSSFEIQLMGSNLNALKLYESLGFRFKEKKEYIGLQEKKLLPCNSKICLFKGL